MICDPYVIYQSMEAANAMIEAMALLPDRIDFSRTHYISDEAAAANLELARLKAAILASYLVYIH